MKHHQHIDHIIIVSVLVALTMIVVACRRTPSLRLKVDAVSDRTKTPVLDAMHVTTLISDSGLTRYRVTTERWLVFDRDTPPHWDFPRGIRLEQFDDSLRVAAQLEADSAYYNQGTQLWHLKGNVRARNSAGTRFLTQDLYWNRPRDSIYSDSAIAVQQTDGVMIRGRGFVSNEAMTQYKIRQTNGLFPSGE